MVILKFFGRENWQCTYNTVLHYSTVMYHSIILYCTELPIHTGGVHLHIRTYVRTYLFIFLDSVAAKFCRELQTLSEEIRPLVANEGHGVLLLPLFDSDDQLIVSFGARSDVNKLRIGPLYKHKQTNLE